MNRMNFKKYIFLLSSVVLLAASCKNDNWEEHYNPDLSGKGTLNLYQLIKNEAELSSFTLMLEKTGYDSILSKSVTYTVWAPKNSKSLDSIAATSDIDHMKLIVRNHISLFAYSTSGLQSKTVFMLNKKFNTFSRSGSDYIFGGKFISSGKVNLAATNGLLHVINEYVPYLSNIWEFILRAENLDSLRNFLDSESEYAFDPDASVEIGTNSFGQAVYDSVITFSNTVLEKIGYLHIEDSIYSALLPNNKAWKVAYNLIKNKYKTRDVDGGAPMQRLNTQMALVRNIIFRTSSAENSDSLQSTAGVVFKSPSYLFTGSSKTRLSNGYAYITDSLRFKASDSWQQSIKIEAENSDYGRKNTFSNLFVRSGLGTTFSSNVSDTKYLLAEAKSVSASEPSSVTFNIPNVLSGKYRVYCVFVPSSIVLATDLRPYKVRFYFTYMQSNGTLFENSPISSTNQLQAASRTAAIFTTTANAVSKMFVTEIEFPYCNLYEKGASSTTITTSLKVENATTAVEEIQKKGDRKMRIDYVIFEPVP